MQRIYMNDSWYFMKVFNPVLLKQHLEKEGLEVVRLPHTNQEINYNYIDEKSYQGICGYRKDFVALEDWKEKAVLITFEGAAHEAILYINGQQVCKHLCGYTAFTVDIAPYLRFGEENSIVLKLDSRESLNIPPFGHVIDYLTYGGIYRDVYLEIKNKLYIADTFVVTEDVLAEEKTLQVDLSLSNWQAGLYVVQQLIPAQGSLKITTPLGKTVLEKQQQTLRYKVKDVVLWDTENPNLYYLETKLFKGDTLLDCHTTRFGFRKAQFKVDGFYLNEKKMKLRGLNRHQSYPYVGYAMPKMPQVSDANLLKAELGVNAVRTSHYPQSHYFIDRCDEIGLLVFTEIPGWQHIGDLKWQEVACENVKEMIMQYRNHPSIILWGVRINESQDDEAFYTKTNAIAHALDATRATGGVRCIKHSQFLEDVYTYNDFIHEGDNRPLSKRRAVTQKVPYLVSEHNGHMYPTKAFDSEAHRLEHALRHTRVLNALYGDEEISGAFGWCMFDYNTHQDFGSGDRICYHGVMDMFRNPKMAASVYAMQQDERGILELSSSMNIGEHPGGILGEIYAFTNAEYIRVYKNHKFIKTYDCSETAYKNMPHGPICIDDFIGNQLESEEGFSKAKSEAIKKILIAGAKYGISHLPLKEKLRALQLVLCHGMTLKDGLALYNKYIGNWGEEAVSYRFEAIKGEKIIATVVKAPLTKVKLQVDVDHTTLVEDHTYDVASIRIRAVDENNNVLNFYNEPIHFEVKGPLSLIGPAQISLKGGMGGTYIKTTGESGEGRLEISGNDFESVCLAFTSKCYCKA